ncbi:MAG TPA: hydrogenase maturation protease [Patescibacteria group bacterium]|jgi:hydrogenase maturation protease|nr:hydrogenase maturation protease [Patescibacteria group bacterium]
MKRILIAGIGNIFFGDDAFGVEVAQELTRCQLPPEVQVIDFGIRSYDLAYALAGDYDAVILVDAVARGQAPGTLYLIEPDLAELGPLSEGLADAHSMNPVRVLQMAESLGGVRALAYLVACEPSTLESPDGELGLTPAVQAAVPKAVEMIESLVNSLLRLETKQDPGFAPV